MAVLLAGVAILPLLSAAHHLVVARAQPAATPKRILLLYWYNREYAGNITFEENFRSALQSLPPGTIEYYSEYLESNRFPGANQSLLLRDYLRGKYADRQIDVIVAVTDRPLEFLLTHRQELFTKIPIVFAAVKSPTATERATGPGMTGIIYGGNQRNTLDLALKLHPGTEQVFIVSGTPEHDKRFELPCRKDLEGYDSKVSITYLTDLPLGELIARTSRLPQHSIILYLWQQSQDEKGNVLESPDVLALIARSAQVPIYGLTSPLLGSGIVGGQLRDPELIAARSAQIAMQIANGARAQDIPVENAGTVPMFDWRQLKRWSISENKLPPGSIVQYRELSFWQQYKERIIGAVALIIVQALLIVFLLVQRRQRRHAQVMLVEKEQRLCEAQTLARIGNFHWDLETNTISWSDELYRIYGLQPDDSPLTYEVYLEQVHPEYREQVRKAVRHALNHREPFEHEYRIARGEEECWVFARGEPVVDADGRVIALQGICQDITERKRVEEEIKASLLKIEQLKEQLQAENTYLQEEIKLEHNFTEIIGNSNAIKYVLFRIEQVAPTDTTVLLLGETGTGKELAARAIHHLSLRRDRPFIKVNCAALSPTLIESELFGHEKGSFTGAQTRKAGRFEVANGGTLFLDEIGELPLELQPKLLRVLQEGEFERLGGSQTIKADVRVIAATNRNLKTEVEKGLFREDLWYRLNVFPMTLPPLRQRLEDLPLLIRFFTDKFSRKFGKPIQSLTSATIQALQTYSWPGNIRELANVIERAVISSQGPVLALADKLENTQDHVPPARDIKSLEEMERAFILQRLEETNWKIEGPHGAAQSLGVNPSTLRHRMHKLGISKTAVHLRAVSRDNA